MSARDLLTVAYSGKTPRKRLEAIDALRRRLEDQEQQTVFSMRLSGATWEDIGKARGTSTQAAHERYAKSAGLLDKLASASGKSSRP